MDLKDEYLRTSLQRVDRFIQSMKSDKDLKYSEEYIEFEFSLKNIKYLHTNRII